MLLRIAIFSPVRRLFDYLPPTEMPIFPLQPGMRVRVPFRNKELIGILIATVNDSEYATTKLKRVVAILDDVPIIAPQLFKLLDWASRYYHHPLGDVLLNALPALIRRGEPLEINNDSSTLLYDVIPHQEHTLTPEQEQVVNIINAQNHHYQTFLLQGITGSGKTEIYLQCMAAIFENKKSILLLVPEINLTPQLVEKVEKRFKLPIAVLHSHLTEKQRFKEWKKVTENQVAIVLGTRSAIFAPITNLGLIIVDEEHDSSFKQQDGFRYSARDLAVVRASMENIPIILGSATPSFESLQNVKLGRYQHLILQNRVGNAKLPAFELIDMRGQYAEHGLASSLIERIKVHLANQHQVLLFINRRGFAPVLLCSDCGWIAECRRCDARLTYHQAKQQLICHHCMTNGKLPNACGSCGSPQLHPVGYGTERIEQGLQLLFPETSIYRIDRDTTRKKSAMQEFLNQIHSEKPCILVGTQMLAKGHHFPRVSLVGIINIDSGLLSTDFRAPEKMAQLLIQVAGRAGRAEIKGEVLIQTHQPYHPMLQELITQGYGRFAESALNERCTAQLPPHSVQAILRAEANTFDKPFLFLQQIKQFAQHQLHSTVEAYGPLPATMMRKAGKHRAELIIQAPQRQQLQNALQQILNYLSTLPDQTKVKWAVDVDPVGNA